MENVIWTPDGVRTMGTATPDRVELRPVVMEWLKVFNDIAAQLKLGLHCGLCGADLIGKNAMSDAVFSVTCGCREFIGPNVHQRTES